MDGDPLWLVSYDIADAKRLKKVYRLCLEQGWALQKSVFVIALKKREKRQFFAQLQDMVDTETDRVLCVPFLTSSEAFHWGSRQDWLTVHEDPRLSAFVF